MPPAVVNWTSLLIPLTRPEEDQGVEQHNQLLEAETWRELDTATMKRTLISNLRFLKRNGPGPSFSRGFLLGRTSHKFASREKGAFLLDA